MEAIYLQSMTDFCLEILDENPPYSEVLMLIKISNYATFLKQPLQLGFFVPCDENGNVLEEPKKWESFLFDPCRCDLCIENTIECENYKKAKERVLFKGFKPCKVNNSQVTYKQKSGITFNILIDGTVEDIIWLSREKFELTETAIKQIEL